MKFAMLICGDPDEWDGTDPARVEAGMREIYGWFEKWSAAGKIVDGGAELDHPRLARTARGSADGQPVVTDGPYLELKEIVGGVVFLEAADIDDAMAVAATWPGLNDPGNSVEVRPVVVR
jgi:hypothetical protein